MQAMVNFPTYQTKNGPSRKRAKRSVEAFTSCPGCQLIGLKLAAWRPGANGANRPIVCTLALGSSARLLATPQPK